ncbi:hypothetical protein [Gordonia terrae]|uniref:hypothetical protein n=1 Tax=Gordonia terrae TaxID=2055 RepID=UPI0035709E98
MGKTGIARLLTSRYYLGLITHAGTERTGQHQPLVSQRLFNQAQAVIERRQASGQRRRKLDHYLKGILYCDTCLQDSNHTRLLSYTETTGRSGQRFQYYYCAKRGRGRHTTYIPAKHAERHVVGIWNELRLTPSFQAVLQDALHPAPVTRRPGRRYRSESVEVRRTMNQAIFTSIYLPAEVTQYA